MPPATLCELSLQLAPQRRASLPTPNIELRVPSPTGPFSRREWLGLLAVFVGWVGYWNWLLPLPDINDFEGLGRICLLMDRQGWLRCVNDNWGFAQSLSCWLLTKVTGNLLISQRLMCCLGGLLAVVSAERVMRMVLCVKSRRVRFWALLAFLLNGYMASALLSTHLDIVAVGLCLLGLSLLAEKAPASQVIAGLALAAATWFRFHFLLFPLLYPAMLAVVHWKDHSWKKVACGVLGVFLGLAVPVAICYAAHGVPMLSNQRLILAMLTPDFSWTVDYQLQLDQQSYVELMSQVRWGRVFKMLVWQFTEQPAILILVAMLAVQGALGLRKFGRKSPAESTRTERADRATPLREPWYLIMLCVMLSLLPFAVLRGLADRLPLAFVLLAFPVLAARVHWPWRRLWGHLTMAVVVCGLLPLPGIHEKFQQDRKAYNIRFKQSVAAMRPDVPADRVFCSTWLPNRGDKYWLWSPVVYGGWVVRNREMREEFGVVDLQRADSPMLGSFDYLITNTKPGNDFESFPPTVLDLGAVKRVGSVQVIANARKASADRY